MTTLIPVNPNILRWARERAGLSFEDVAKKLGRKSITAQVVEEWEEDIATPSYAQLETLAYKIYKCPLAVFFFPEPPEEETPQQAFRTLPKQEIEQMSSRLRYLLRQARVMQLNLQELYDGANPATNQIVHDLEFTPDISESKMAKMVRNYLGIDLNEQSAWNTFDQALKGWREAFETHGIFVFKEAFKDDSFSGFCLYDNQFPIIYVNNSQPDTRQIFTLFHELAHLLLRTGGVDTRKDDYINYLTGNDRKIEILCNRFAGAFLVPNSDFSQRIKGLSITDKLIQKLSVFYNVSREVILRKCLDRELIDQTLYEKKTAQWEREWKEKSGNGGNYYLTKRVYLGEHYIERVFSRYYQKRISIEQVADYLGVKVNNVPGMEALLFP